MRLETGLELLVMSMCEAVSVGDVKGTICIVCNTKVIFDIVSFFLQLSKGAARLHILVISFKSKSGEYIF